MDEQSLGSPLSDIVSWSSSYSPQHSPNPISGVNEDGNDHCYDSYYSVYNNSEQEYFADDNPLSLDKSDLSNRRKFSGVLGVRIEQSLDVGSDDDDPLDNLSGKKIQINYVTS